VKKPKPGLGFSTAVIDRAFWLCDDWGRVEGQDWIEALEAIDVRGDKSRLIELLRSDMPLPDSSRRYLADLIERYELKRPRGGRSTPAYDRSGAEAMLLLAKEEIEYERRHNGKTTKQAIDEVAKALQLNSEIVRNFIEGRRGSSRRAKR
jgi:hypothetical protein